MGQGRSRGRRFRIFGGFYACPLYETLKFSVFPRKILHSPLDLDLSSTDRVVVEVQLLAVAGRGRTFSKPGKPGRI